jgi:cysteine desulfurase
VLESPIYLDHNASTPPDPEVVEVMLSWLGNKHANPHSEHLNGRVAAQAVEAAKSSIGALIGSDGDDIILTSGATESNNLILQGFLGHGKQSRSLLVSAIEHKCILETAHALAEQGVRIEVIPVDPMGAVSVTQIREMVDEHRAERCLVSVMHGNNEIGSIAPLRAITDALAGSLALFHTDAAQTVGKLPLDVDDLRVDFLSLSAHKIYGPAGIGAVYIAPGLREQLHPIFHGGGQQHGLRPGTIPVFLAAGFGKACELALARRDADAANLRCLTEGFLASLREEMIIFEIVGDPQTGLPGLLSLRFPGVQASSLLERMLRTVSASSGSACAAGELRSSHVLSSIGLSPEIAREVVRFGVGRSTSISQVVNAARQVAVALRAAACEK